MLKITQNHRVALLQAKLTNNNIEGNKLLQFHETVNTAIQH